MSTQPMEEVSLSGSSPDIVFDLCIARRSPGTKVCTGEYWLKLDVKQNDNDKIKRWKSYVVPKSQNTLKINENDYSWTIGDLTVTCLSSFQKYRIHFNGYLRNSVSGEVDHVRLAYIWKPYSVIQDHHCMITNKALAETLVGSKCSVQSRIDDVMEQYDQWGALDGSFSINASEPTEIVLRGNKSRHSGKFNWSDVYRFVRIRIYIHDGRTLNFNAICMGEDLPNMVWGYVDLSTGFVHRFTNTDFRLESAKCIEDFAPAFSIRISTNKDEYILDASLNLENSKNADCGPQRWGQNQDTLAWVIRLDNVCVTNVTQGYKQQATGHLHFFTKTDQISETNFQLCEDHSLVCADLKEEDFKKVVLPFNDTACRDPRLTGGKGSSLAVLKSLSNKENFEVPNGFCISISANDTHVKESNLKHDIASLTKACSESKQKEIKEICTRIEEKFINLSISHELFDGIRRTMLTTFGGEFEQRKFAVRSSASGEDGEEMSGAGQMKTILGCVGLDKILKAVKQCWASCYSFKAVEYRRQNGQIIETGMGVVVQEMVRAEAAGVLFTRDPITGNPGIISISSNYGLGESVVSASSDPDTISVSRSVEDKLTISKIVVGAKGTQVIMKDDGGVEEVENQKSTCSLSHDMILKLSEISLKVENCYGDSRDIEWAIITDQIYLLQARPITGLDNYTEFELENEFNYPVMSDNTMYTSGNLREVMPGAAAPITSAFLIPTLSKGLGTVKKMMSPDGNDGAIFVRSNVNFKWCRFADRIEMMFLNNKKNPDQQSINMKKCFDIAFNGRTLDDDYIKQAAHRRHGFQSKYSVFRGIIAFIKNVYMTKKNLNEMKKMFGDWTFQNSNCNSSKELARAIFTNTDFLTKSVIGHLKVTMSSVLRNASVLSDLLGTDQDFADNHLADFAMLMSISSSSEHVESADVPSALQVLAAAITKCISKNHFLAMSNEECVDWLTATENIKEIFQDFLNKHGHRSSKEFDMYVKTWDMDPTQLIMPLKACLKQNTVNQPKKLNIDEALEKLQTKLTSSQKKKLRGKVLQARESVAYREQAKSLMIRTIHQYRKELWRLGHMMVVEGRIPEPELVLFMTVEEIYKLFKTRSPKIIQRAIHRRRLYPKLDTLVFPEISYGVLKAVNKTVEIPEGAFTLEGIPVSHGMVKAKVRVVTQISEADQIQPGEILVTFATDIAWSPYFPSLGGLVTEIGGLVSHGAVVAREYGIPCVVGVQNVTVLLKTGDMVVLNGSAGSVSKLETEL